MPFEITLQEGERVIANLTFMVPNGPAAFHIAVTDRAVFLPGKKAFAVKDPTYAERVGLNQVVEVKIKKLGSVFLWILAALMVLGGAAVTMLMMRPVLQGQGGHISGYPPAIAVVGLVIPFLARRRYGLTIAMVGRTFRWKPRLYVDKASRSAAGRFLTDVSTAFREAGVSVKDERESAEPSSQETKPEKYPVAIPASASGSGGVLRSCRHCGKALRISRWDDWNGFILRCPYCEGLYGTCWSLNRTLLASLFLNAFSFFFVLRWKRALPWFLGFVLLAAITNFAVDRDYGSQMFQMVLVGICVLGPMAVNSVFLMQHEMALRTATVVSK